jgi:nitroreductase
MTDTGRAAIDLAQFELLATGRRTSLRMDSERQVPRELIERLCRLVTWAPNHKKTWPWRFALFTGEGRAELGSTIADALARGGLGDEKRLEKYRQKYLRAPSMLVVGAAPGDDELRTVENRDAVAAGVENLLLGATAAGLASFWSSGARDADAAVAELAGWEEGTSMVAVIYLGWPAGEVPVPERPLPEVVVVDERRGHP